MQRRPVVSSKIVETSAPIPDPFALTLPADLPENARKMLMISELLSEGVLEKSEEEKPPIVELLSESQFAHVAKLLKILAAFPFAIDQSSMGCGKSYTTSAVAQLLDYPSVIVICPGSMEGQWSALFEHRNLGIPYIIKSYEMLRSKKLAPDSLVRFDYGTTGLNVINTTSLFNNLAREGTLLILDESHRTKNEALTMQVVRVMISKIIELALRESSLSRVLMLTGTLFDKTTNAVVLSKLLNIITLPDIGRYNRSYRSFELTGGWELVKFVHRNILLRSETDRILDIGQSSVHDRESAEEFVMEVTVNYLLKAFATSMPPVRAELARGGGERSERDEVEEREFGVDDEWRRGDDDENGDVEDAFLDVANFYANVEKTPPSWSELTALESYRSVLDQVAIAAGYGETSSFRFSLRDYSKALENLEIVKTPTLVRLAIENFYNFPTSKLILGFNYHKSMNICLHLLATELPGVKIEFIKGSTSKTARTQIFREFQEDSNTLRVLVAMQETISLGIDLDDQFGTHPRIMLLMPGNRTISAHQLVRRIFRKNTMGKATVRFIYSYLPERLHQRDTREDRILFLGARKANTLKKTSDAGTVASLVYAGDYEMIYEDSGFGSGDAKEKELVREVRFAFKQSASKQKSFSAEPMLGSKKYFGFPKI